MGRIIDLTGQRFNKLTVIEKTDERKNRQVVWKCKCDCGNITYVVGQALRTGPTKSCGCLNYEKDNSSLINQKFGKIKVLKRSEKNLNKKIYWECICECGNTLKSENNFCSVCGKKIELEEESSVECSRCSVLNEDNSIYCGCCGIKL